MNEMRKTIFKIYEKNGFDSVETYFKENEKTIPELSKKEMMEVYFSLARIGIINQKTDFTRKILNRFAFENSETKNEKYNELNKQLFLLTEVKNKSILNNPYSSDVIVLNIPGVHAPRNGTYINNICCYISNFAKGKSAIICFEKTLDKPESIKYFGRWREVTTYEGDHLSSKEIQDILPYEIINKVPTFICSHDDISTEPIPVLIGNSTIYANVRYDYSFEPAKGEIIEYQLSEDDLISSTGISDWKILDKNQKGHVLRGNSDQIINYARYLWTNYLRRKYGIQKR